MAQPDWSRHRAGLLGAEIVDAGHPPASAHSIIAIIYSSKLQIDLRYDIFWDEIYFEMLYVLI